MKKWQQKQENKIGSFDYLRSDARKGFLNGIKLAFDLSFEDKMDKKEV